MGQIDGETEIADAAPLRSRLEDAAVAPNRIVQVHAVAHRDAARFFAIDVFARLGRQNRSQRMPAVSGGDQQGVDIVSGQQFEHVAIHRAILVAVMRIGHLFDQIATLGLDIAHCHEAHIRLGQHAIQHRSPSWPDTQSAKNDSVARRHGSVPAKRACRDDRWRGQRHCSFFQKPSSRNTWRHIDFLRRDKGRIGQCGNANNKEIAGAPGAEFRADPAMAF
ncbi:MAG: hypothetical protein BWZ10_03321 [candidate division BRC1 bacterium ADurb.BinA364]|nr:MAG: hypothetical protein BWZ10_03321 [candidate division BRC1 bacterium ADurb.BinA364]